MDNHFIYEWVARSNRREGEDFIDIGDKFISLWIAFNAWLKSEFGENVSDRVLIDTLSKFKPMNDAFDDELASNKKVSDSLSALEQFHIIDMRDPNNEEKLTRYDGTFKSLIETLYRIRCNLFHGRKNIEDDKYDKELVQLAFSILLPIFENYMSNNGL